MNTKGNSPILNATDGKVSEIWCDTSPVTGQRVILLRTPGGPKAYRRIWLDHEIGTDDWTWHKSADAVRMDLNE